ncbi:ABC transporter substrate-binding protein [Persicimonas caeni]|uniref:ABC transporter substrate-binding protein n=1 Tax=Persicimonas caeni TaxID=2292766 RepID=A0A4Y6PNP2_PERCE|nr:TRAP transporter substrate-binding protein DctP [Persicimonas caeni]QDG49627.1 ABC transporter substrate-binding protein [Persicimonas caeni]QED30848.1 ABC transporter substrate-binding protein [Persicimonas caeni]
MDSRAGTIQRLGLTVLVALVGLMVGVGPVSAEEKQTLKIATLAPKGSSWMKSFEDAKRQIEKKTDGQVTLKLYPGGVMGDESAMVRKMRTGQLDGGAVTSVGLGEIDKKMLVLQLPLTFRNHKELDYVRDKMSGTFEKMLADKGFKLLTWGDVGFNYLFTQTPVQTPKDLHKTTPWVWNTDPITKGVMEVMNVNAVPLGVPDVLTSLQTGVIDAFLNSPYGAVALQWYTKADYVTNMRLAVVIGGVVVTAKAMNKLSEEHQKIVMDTFRAEGKDLLAQIRKDNQQAMKTIEKAGVKAVQPKDFDEWKKIADKTREELTGKLFPKELVDEMMKHLKAAR